MAGFGTLAARLEQATYADRRSAGVVHVALLVGAGVAAGVAAEHVGRHRPVPHALLTAAATWTVLGGTTLDREAAAVGRLLRRGGCPRPAPRWRGWSDATPAPWRPPRWPAPRSSRWPRTPPTPWSRRWCWARWSAIPGLLGYRAANTLDAMVGHRSARYARFGWAAARLDDVLNLPGSRLTATLATVLGADPAASVRAWRRDAGAHPSPNAGPVEAAFAGALGVRLGGRTVYGTGPEARVELRPALGEGPLRLLTTSPAAGGSRPGWAWVRSSWWHRSQPGQRALDVADGHDARRRVGRRTTTTGTPSAAAASILGQVCAPPESLVTSTSTRCSRISAPSPSSS